MAEIRGAWNEVINVPDEPIVENGNDTPPAVVVDDVTNDTPPATDDTPPDDLPVTPQIVERVVEVIKEVEKPHTFANDAARVLYEQFTAGNEDVVADYLAEKKRDYDNMSDIDAVKWELRKANPDWKEKDLDIEIRYKYGKDFEPADLNLIDKEADPEDYKAAEARNERIEASLLKLQVDSRNARITLNKGKQNIELPKLPQVAQAVSEPDKPTQEQLDAQKLEWDNYVEAEMPKLTDYKFEVEGEEVTYKMTDTEKATAKTEMKGFNAAEKLTELGWRDANGTLIPAKIAQDMHTLRNVDKLIKSAFSQGKTAGKKELVTTDIKNINLNNHLSGSTATPVDAWSRSSQTHN